VLAPTAYQKTFLMTSMPTPAIGQSSRPSFLQHKFNFFESSFEDVVSLPKNNITLGKLKLNVPIGRIGKGK